MKPEVKQAIYQEVTSALIAEMERGVTIWQKPWVISKAYQPQNGASNRLYNGFNRMYLGYMQTEKFGSNDPRWFTMNNVKAIKDAKVIKGSKSTIIVFNKLHINEVEEDGETKTKKWWQTTYHRVFHASQITGLPEYDAEADVPEQPDADQYDDALSILDEWCHENLESFVYAGDRACYSPLMDAISIPMPDTFKRKSWLIQTLAHEIIHATGHTSRLDRLDFSTFGSETYAKEELVAEFGAAMLCGTLGVDPDMEQSAAYLKGWAAKCKDEPGLLIAAANAAERAVNYVTQEEYAVV